MKKTLIISAAIIAVTAGTSFAAGKIPTTTIGTKPFTFKQSSNVEISYWTTNGATAAPATPNVNYVANSKNASGNRVFSSSNNTSNVWYQENDAWKGSTIAATGKEMKTPASNTDTDYAGWSSM